MFGIVIDWPDMKRSMRRALDVQLGALAGVAFMALAMASIEYEEIIAPGVSRLSDACSSAAHVVGRKLASSLAL